MTCVTQTIGLVTRKQHTTKHPNSLSMAVRVLTLDLLATLVQCA